MAHSGQKFALGRAGSLGSQCHLVRLFDSLLQLLVGFCQFFLDLSAFFNLLLQFHIRGLNVAV